MVRRIGQRRLNSSYVQVSKQALFLAQKAAASTAMETAPRTVIVVAPDVGVGALKTTSTWVTGGITVAVL